MKNSHDSIAFLFLRRGKLVAIVVYSSFKGVSTGCLGKISRKLVAASQIIELSGILERKRVHSVSAQHCSTSCWFEWL